MPIQVQFQGAIREPKGTNRNQRAFRDPDQVNDTDPFFAGFEDYVSGLVRQSRVEAPNKANAAEPTG